MNFSIYDIRTELLSLFRELDSTEDPELRAALLKRIEEVQMSEADKREAWCCYIKNRKALLKAIKEEINVMKAKAAALDASIVSDENYLSKFIPLEEKKWERGLHEMGWRKCPPSAKPVDPKIIPAQYMREEISYAPDCKTALADMKMGTVIPGFELIENKHNFYIK